VSRWAAFASVAALLLSGIAIGALGMHLIEERRASPPPFGHPPHGRAAIDHLERELELTAAQREQMEAILDESWRAGEEIRREVRPRLDRHIAETEQRIREVLTPAQRSRFDALRREHRVRADRLFLGPPGPHGPHGPHGPPRASPGVDAAPRPGPQEDPPPPSP
jgi:Spy/CpxP family protein refolding chaperone